METFKAEEKSIRNLFQEKISYIIPSYQRPYSWEKDEIEKFCEDILLSYKNKDEYLLSSIILVEHKKDKLYEVIDGQQRLTTISIFLSVLKTFLKDNDNIEDINNRILNGTEIRVQRVQTDKSFHQDFQEVLQNFNYETFQELCKKRKYKKNNYYQNAKIIYDILSSEEYKRINFDDFYDDFFIDKVYLIRVYTTQESKAMRLFEVLNSRGLPLKNTDLIKNHIMEKIYESYEEETKETGISAFEELWKEMSSELDNLNESMEDLFTYYVYMKLKENPKNSLFEEFKLILKKDFENNGNKIDKFISDINHFFKKYLELYSERKDIISYRKIHSMKYLREGRFWKTILTTYSIKYPTDDIKKIVDILFNFYFLNYIAGESVNPYKQFSFNLIKNIAEEKLNFEKLNKDIEDYYKKQNTLYRFKSKLNDEIYKERWSKIIFYLIEYFHYKDKEDYEIFEQNNKKIQVEHIFPQNEKHWKKELEKDTNLTELRNNLGNLTLLYQSNNVKCSNLDFNSKLEIYKISQKFNHTKEILKFLKWDSESINSRQKKILNQIENIFNIEKNYLSEN
jgi:uncharacterized protein with ParB-like and HNH nuclease domain